jgi:hypothetical protein
MLNTTAGGCQCGAIRYESTAEPGFSIVCYCRQCQRVTGTGHAPQFALPAKEVSIVGAVKTYEMRADSGNTVSSGFCPDCGSPVMKKSSGYPDIVFFHAATLDAPALFKPRRSVWSRSRQPWDCLDPNLPVDT